MNSDKLNKKLKSLLAMSNDKSSENEAMIALKQLHIMLAKHNMSMSDISSEQDPISEDGEEIRNKPWKRRVALSIAKLYFCDMYPDELCKRKAFYMFVGTTNNRTFAIAVFKMVIATIEREGLRTCKEIHGKRNKSYLTSFYNGAMFRIVERCKLLVRESKTGEALDEEGNKLPALISLYESTSLVIKEWSDLNLDLVYNTPRQTKCNDLTGLQNGIDTGNKVPLSRALHADNKPKLIEN